MKVPLKGLLSAFHLTLADLTPKSPTPGIEIDGNNCNFDTQRLLPSSHIHGQISKVQDVSLAMIDASQDP